MLALYPQSQYQDHLPGPQQTSYIQDSHMHDPNLVSTLPMQRPVIPSLEEAAEADDTSTRPRLTQEQIAVLEDNFKSKPKPGTDFKKQLASRIGLSLQRVNNWYQNRRAKARHQRPQERRFDVLPNDPAALWSSVDLAFPDYANEMNDVLDLSPQDSHPAVHPPTVGGICIPNSEDASDDASNFNTELDMFHGYLNSVGTDSDLSLEGDLGPSLPLPDANNLAMTKMDASDVPAWGLQEWVSESQPGPQFTEEGLAALQATQSAFSQAMYQSASEGYHVGNPSCQTFATASSSDGEQPSLMTPPPRTSPLPFPCQEPFTRRQSVTADLASDFNTIHLKRSQSNVGLNNGQADATHATTSHSPVGTPPAPPRLHIDAGTTHSESLPNSLIGGSTVPRLDIASRRKRPRPAALRPEAQRSMSYGPMTLSPTARMSSLGISKTASVRRIKSTGNGLNTGNGRIQKPGVVGPAPMSPRNFHQLSSNDFLGSNDHGTNASSQSITPLTPLSPLTVEQQTQAWLSQWAHTQDHATPTAPDSGPHFTSPPITPYETGFQPSFPRVGHQASYHWPPQSAPPQQTTFFDSPPMPPTNFSHLNWQVPSSTSLQGHYEEPPNQIVRPPMMPQYGFLDLQPLPSQHQHVYQQMGFFQPPFLESSPPQKEIEIQVQVIPAPEGLPQGRKTYTFNHTTPQDFSNAEGTSTKVAGTTDPNPV